MFELTERTSGVDKQGLCLINTGMWLAGYAGAGGQIGAEHVRDRGCNTKMGEGESLLSPVLLAHHELCSCTLMLESSKLVPFLLRWRLSALYRSLLVQKESKLLMKP